MTIRVPTSTHTTPYFYTLCSSLLFCVAFVSWCNCNVLNLKKQCSIFVLLLFVSSTIVCFSCLQYKINFLVARKDVLFIWIYSGVVAIQFEPLAHSISVYRSKKRRYNYIKKTTNDNQIKDNNPYFTPREYILFSIILILVIYNIVLFYNFRNYTAPALV